MAFLGLAGVTLRAFPRSIDLHERFRLTGRWLAHDWNGDDTMARRSGGSLSQRRESTSRAGVTHWGVMQQRVMGLQLDARDRRRSPAN